MYIFFKTDKCKCYFDAIILKGFDWCVPFSTIYNILHTAPLKKLNCPFKQTTGWRIKFSPHFLWPCSRFDSGISQYLPLQVRPTVNEEAWVTTATGELYFVLKKIERHKPTQVWLYNVLIVLSCFSINIL